MTKKWIAVPLTCLLLFGLSIPAIACCEGDPPGECYTCEDGVWVQYGNCWGGCPDYCYQCVDCWCQCTEPSISVDPYDIACVGCLRGLSVGVHPYCCDHVVWSAPGGDPASQSGVCGFTTHWDTPGIKTVTATTTCDSGSKQVTIVKVGKVVEEGTDDEGPLEVPPCCNVRLQAKPDPASAGFPCVIDWSIVSKPPGSNPSVTPDATDSTRATLSGLTEFGDYVVKAKTLGCDGHEGPGDTITVTVSLPEGCSSCTGPPAPPTPSKSEDTQCTKCATCGCSGYVDVDPDISKHPYTLKTPCYDDCKWYAYLDTVHTTVEICRSCPANPPTVACLDEVAGMTEAEACAHKKNFPNDPVEYADINTNNWCRDCVAKHEEAHMNKDWLQDSLQPEINDFNTFLAGFGININCGVSSSTDCSTALTPTIKQLLDMKWALHIASARLALQSESHDDANAAELACYQAIRDALKAKCPD